MLLPDRSAQIEEVLEAEGEARGGHHSAGAQQDARHEAAVVEGVVADGEGLALTAEEDLLVGEEAAEAYGVDGDPVDARAPGTVQGGHRGVGLRGAAGALAGGGD